MTYDESETTEQEAEDKPKTKGMAKLAGYIGMDNIADDLDSTLLAKIGQQVVEEYETDLNSMSEWLDGYNKGLELSKLTATEKTFPWPKAANIKFPLIANAALKFSARAYPEIIRNTEVVSCRIVGDDPDDQKHLRGKRVAKFMNWQLMVEMIGWDTDMDRLLTMLPVCGQMFKKTYFNPVLESNVSELVNGDRLIVNQQAQSWERARRKTHVYDLYHNEVIEMQRMDMFVDCKLLADDNVDAPDDIIHEILEQHRFLDLDDDGYEEPYIVTVDKSSGKVLRIRARFKRKNVTEKKGKIVRIKADEYFTPYGFLPAFDGSLYSVGFGHLIYPLNEAANTIINQLLDSGTLSNTSGGFIGKGLRLKGGALRFTPGEWKPVDAQGQDIANNIVPIPSKEASPALFNLLGMIIDAANDMASVKDVLSGDLPGSNVPATTVLALIEQGQKTFNSIYKRIWRALSNELRQLYLLDAEFLDASQYATVLDDPQASPSDFELSDSDIIPVADPAVSSTAQRMALAQAAMSMSGRPGVNESLLTNEYFKAIGHPKADMIAPYDPNGGQQQMMKQAHDEGMAMGQQQAMQQIDAQIKHREIELKEHEFALKERQAETQNEQLLAAIQKTVVETLEKLVNIPPAALQVAIAETSMIPQPKEESEEYEYNQGAIPVMGREPSDDTYYGNTEGVEGVEGSGFEGEVPQFMPQPEQQPLGVDSNDQQNAGLY